MAKKRDRKEYMRTYYKNNKESMTSSNESRKKSEGIGVYKATYPSGIYIGSGNIYPRRCDHMTGNSRIAKTLGECATSFEVLHVTNTRKLAYKMEEETIKIQGLSNLLNKRCK